MAAAILYLMVLFGVIVASVGTTKINDYLESCGFTEKMKQAPEDYLHALAVFVGWAPFSLFLLLAFVNQRLRTCLRNCNITNDPQGGRVFNAVATGMLERMSEWHWGSVSSKITVIGLVVLFTEVIVGKAVVVFLSWFSALLADVSLGLVVLIFFLVGIFMFLNPAIPGIPVYLCAGVLLPAAVMGEGWQTSGLSQPPLEFWYGIGLASAVSVLLKFVAIAIQQEVIGRRLGAYVTVRSFCQINSKFMRGAKLVLQDRGCTSGKAMILIGGPDWPTSVVTGIMKLSLLQMLVGSMPIVLLIIPSVLVGGFNLISSLSDLWSTLANVVTLFAFAIQGAALIGAGLVIDRAVEERAMDLAAMPYDAEVMALEKKLEKYEQARRLCTTWRDPKSPLWPRVLLVTTNLMVIFACYAAIFYSSRTFRPFAVSDSIADLPGGVGHLIVYPAGWLVLGCFVCAWLLFDIYRRWARCETLSFLDRHVVLGIPAESDGVPLTLRDGEHPKPPQGLPPGSKYGRSEQPARASPEADVSPPSSTPQSPTMTPPEAPAKNHQILNNPLLVSDHC